MEKIREFQLRRIRFICQYAYENTDFYRQRFEEIGIRSFEHLSFEDFRRIPVLTKEDLHEHVSGLISKRHQRLNLRQSATGGTTSSPTAIYMDWPTLHRRWAATYECDRRIGYVRGQKIAYLWGAQQDFSLSPSWKQRLLARLVTQETYLPTCPLDDETLARYYDVLRRWRPTFMQAYPSPLAIFSEFLIRKRLSLHIPNISVTAEPLLPRQDEIITRAFGRRPYNWYGARESGRIATDCKFHSGMHVNSHGNYVEIETRKGFTEFGMGTILITDLWNQGMPMIRYEIGDVGVMTDEVCECGSQLPRITTLAGRTTDVFVNSKGQRIPGVAFTNRIVKVNSEIREMQFIQKEIGVFEILVVPGEQWNGETTKSQIRRKLDEFMNESTEAQVRIVDEIPREQSGKVRFCRSEVAAVSYY